MSHQVASTKHVENPAFVDELLKGKPWAFHIDEETHKGLSAFEDMDRGYLGGKPLRWIVYDSLHSGWGIQNFDILTIELLQTIGLALKNH